MSKKQLLLVIGFFISSMVLAQNRQQVHKPDKTLDTYTEGEFVIKTYYTTIDNTYTYEITKNKAKVFSETVRLQKGSSLGYMDKEQVRNEVMKIAKFVLRHEKIKYNKQ